MKYLIAGIVVVFVLIVVGDSSQSLAPLCDFLLPEKPILWLLHMHSFPLHDPLGALLFLGLDVLAYSLGIRGLVFGIAYLHARL